MTPAAVRALQLRQRLAKTSTSKLEAFKSRTGPDARLRHEYVYAGAHTLRWSSRGVQIHNLPRGTLKSAAYDAAVAAIRNGADITSFGHAQDVVSSTLRGGFRAPDGYHFVVSDLAQIEVRVLADLSGCPRLTRVFQEGLCPYKDFFSLWQRKPIEQVTAYERQISKAPVLGSGYGLGPGEQKVDQNGDEYKTGLWGYAENLGIALTREQAIDMTFSYRSLYAHVPLLWSALEAAVQNAVAYGVTTQVGPVTIGCIPEKLLWIALNSGRRLHYPRPRIQGRDVTYIGHLGKNQVVKKLYGGLLTENLCQSIGRHVLAEGMLAAEDAGFTIVGHTHDECICLERIDDHEHTVARLNAILSTTPAWGPNLILGADGWAGPVYKKA